MRTETFGEISTRETCVPLTVMNATRQNESEIEIFKIMKFYIKQVITMIYIIYKGEMKDQRIIKCKV